MAARVPGYRCFTGIAVLLMCVLAGGTALGGALRPVAGYAQERAGVVQPASDTRSAIFKPLHAPARAQPRSDGAARSLLAGQTSSFRSASRAPVQAPRASARKAVPVTRGQDLGLRFRPDENDSPYGQVIVPDAAGGGFTQPDGQSAFRPIAPKRKPTYEELQEAERASVPMPGPFGVPPATPFPVLPMPPLGPAPLPVW